MRRNVAHASGRTGIVGYHDIPTDTLLPTKPPGLVRAPVGNVRSMADRGASSGFDCWGVLFS